MSSSRTGTTKFYLVSKIKQSQHKHNEALADYVKGNGFIPHLNNPFNIPHEKLEESVFEVDLNAMEEADFGVVSLPIGSDCSAEVGWFCGNGKPVFAYLYDSGYGYSCREQYENLKTRWMVKGFLTGVIVVGDAELYQEVCNDPILRGKVSYVPS